MCELSPVSFHGDTIFIFNFHDQPFTPMRPIIENMGLDWGSQSAKLNANKKRWTVAMIATVAQDGLEREMLCMPVRKLPAYLASINPKKVRPELRPKIELYQNESDDALWNYWMNGRAERKVLTNPTNTADAPITPDQQCTLKSILRARIPTEGLNKGQVMRYYQKGWSRFNNHFRIARYCQLPQARMAEAVEYLVKMELAPMKKLDTDKDLFPNVPLMVGKTPNGYEKSVFDHLGDVKWKLDELANLLQLLHSPRMMRLPLEIKLLHENFTDCIRAAQAGISMAILNVRNAYRIKDVVRFVKD